MKTYGDQLVLNEEVSEENKVEEKGPLILKQKSN